ncbi:uncharacterized protein Z520_02829 [Fonsecaea multimorphosa CBS 102226]|uniref:Uncharacterized protein n=1 Tax=Fonsecaea multimorphosa CBS 102226 TaxID=1442371 RepID=A0A0D2IW49_9EURO|nr:uncharacterized protein Z520_02829 [Fonsecaea multimorphosa CBS 102226]KIY01277.1 hypothetical protein Z520_02829 [Fonsecaea multimorphosa CBS 102226]OAL28555.1 hypothetical protein AYO22_02749 [Fonsecaea multimorphosa]
MPSHAQVSAHGAHGIILLGHNNTSVAHVDAVSSKTPFASIGIPVTMLELDSGTATKPGTKSSSSASPAVSFNGQFGLIDFDSSIRLPRHVHIAPPEASGDEFNEIKRTFVTERILVLDGVALVELNGSVYVVPPRTLVTIAPGVPHTWTACPAGVSFSEAARLCGGPIHPHSETETGTQSKTFPVSNGSFLMVYEYEDPTGFFPTEQTETLESVKDYIRCDDLERIRFPQMSAQDIYKKGWFILGGEVWNLGEGISTSI